VYVCVCARADALDTPSWQVPCVCVCVCVCVRVSVCVSVHARERIGTHRHGKSHVLGQLRYAQSASPLQPPFIFIMALVLLACPLTRSCLSLIPPLCSPAADVG